MTDHPLVPVVEGELVSSTAQRRDVVRTAAQRDPLQLFALAAHHQLIDLYALSPATRVAYADSWQVFVTCCERFGVRAFPADAQSITLFIEHVSPFNPDTPYEFMTAASLREKSLSASSLRRALAAIGAAHELLGLDNPTRASVVKKRTRIHTKKRSASTSKDGLPWHVIEQGLRAFGDDLASLRDKAIVAVAHSTLCRRGEVTAMRVEHYTASQTGPGGVMFIPFSKTDQEGKGAVQPVTPAARALLEQWLAAAEITSGWLFPRLLRNGRPSPTKALDGSYIAKLYKRVARAAGLDDVGVSKISGHSTRIGATEDLGAFGATGPQLQRAGRWKSPMMPSHYLRNQEAEQSVMMQWAAGEARNPADDAERASE